MTRQFHGAAVITDGGPGPGSFALGVAVEGVAVVIVEPRGDDVNRVPAEATPAGGRAVGLPTDIADPGSVATMAEAVQSQQGPPARRASVPELFGLRFVYWSDADRRTVGSPSTGLNLGRVFTAMSATSAAW